MNAMLHTLRLYFGQSQADKQLNSKPNEFVAEVQAIKPTPH
jgi:hypothetical protein